ncbi:hypothetical protein KUH32_02910 [Thalassococcus sp. CAU 1522]|uniref:Peptidase M48 domain-containing protein n=1 Tax=Thalassococcus arenae TaxID=2851652 RepID=A0ABS6N599_9RHOB|nr:hypothetical protein [Thalassococcus arenae]MBV2358710.1 hypothetical protein [Thalassococcus arenae]
MTALSEYDRLEAVGLWRASPEDQRREVIVSLGDATLTMTDTKGQVLAHWSLAAISRANRGAGPVLYHPDGDPGETLELAEDETQMIDGIERLLRAIDRRRPHPGKLRFVLAAGFTAALLAAAFLWLPDALLRHTVNVVPAVKRAEIGAALMARMTRVTGAPCAQPDGQRALRNLARRLLGEGRAEALVVLPSAVPGTAHLPGRRILLNRTIVEDFEDPDVTAGFVLAEHLRAQRSDPLGDLLNEAGLWASLRLLTTGVLPDAALDAYAERLLAQQPDRLPDALLLDAFEKAELRSAPYAYALDITGETTLSLIEADPRAAEGSRQVLSDSDWLRLQSICEG